jgi:hypothetical protein
MRRTTVARYRQFRNFSVPCRTYIFFFLWWNSPTRAKAASLLRFVGHTQLDTHTAGRTPLDEWSARRKGRYLHNKHNRRTPSAGFKPTITAIERLQNYALAQTYINLTDTIFFFWTLPIIYFVKKDDVSEASFASVFRQGKHEIRWIP